MVISVHFGQFLGFWGTFFTIGLPKWELFGHLEKNDQYHLKDHTNLSTFKKMKAQKWFVFENIGKSVIRQFFDLEPSKELKMANNKQNMIKIEYYGH